VTHLTNKELAEGLGVPPARVCEWRRRGMPTDSIANAYRWRCLHAPPRLKSMAKRATLTSERHLSPSEVTDTDVDGIEFYSVDPGINETLKNMTRQDRLALLHILQAGETQT
jgi:hypothetical protein